MVVKDLAYFQYEYKHILLGDLVGMFLQANDDKIRFDIINNKEEEIFSNIRINTIPRYYLNCEILYITDSCTSLLEVKINV